VAHSDELVKKIAALARAAPPEWRDFLAEFGKYADGVKEQCIQAPLGNLQKAQGHAQQAAGIKVLFEGAVSTADRINARK
jgi:hypothetical protein